MDPSTATKKDARPKPYLIELPMELHIRIRNQLLRDIDTTIKKLRSLRTVCKTFNNVWSAVINTDLVLSLGGPDTLDRLRYLVDAEGKSSYTTLTIKCQRSVAIADIVAQVKDLVTSLPPTLDLPNVHCATLIYEHKDGNWLIPLSATIILALQQLTELEIGICDATDVQSLVHHLEPLTRLQKLTLLPSKKITQSQVKSIASVIARNTNLTYLGCDWKPTRTLDLTELFREIPTEQPLQLEHVSLNEKCTNFHALLPHIKTPLSSFEFHAFETNTWCNVFTQAKVFPPTIKVDCLDMALMSYIEAHEKIVNFTSTADVISIDATPGSVHYPSLFQYLVKHCDSLKYMCINTEILHIMLQTPPERLGFLRCVINLDEIVIMNDKTSDEYQNQNLLIQDEKRILPVISLGRTLTCGILCKDKAVYTLSRDYCRGEASNPLLQDLVGRIYYIEDTS